MERLDKKPRPRQIDDRQIEAAVEQYRRWLTSEAPSNLGKTLTLKVHVGVDGFVNQEDLTLRPVKLV